MKIEQVTSEEFEKVLEERKSYKKGKYSKYLYDMEVGECKKFVFEDPHEYRIACGAIYNIGKRYGLKVAMSKAEKTIWARKEKQ